jgi:mono/diheme cytochrome c family protein
MKRAAWIVAMLVVVGVAALGWAYLGQYNVAADVPHWGLTSRALALVRDRSIATGAADLAVPDLADRDLIAKGAEHYSEMCTGCHLAPGVTTSELRQGLYPAPPDFSAGITVRPAEAFWVIKHGIKMSAMPAWGSTHDDEAIWAIVAFLQQLPTLDANEYSALTGKSDTVDHDHETGEHDHEHNASAHDELTTPAAADPGGTTMDRPSALPHAPTHANYHEHS